MIKQILKFFGFTLITKEEYSQILDKVSSLEKKANEINTIQNNLFEFKSFKPELTYKEFCEKNNLTDKPYTGKYHGKYWKDQYQAAHIGYELRRISMHPKLLQCFLQEFSKFDWVGTAEFMKKHNWCYSGDKETPTVTELQYTVISLIPNDFTHPDNTIMSGGFEVTLSYVDSIPQCKIFFRESDVQYT
jgi:hypothetical protein